MTTHQAPKTTIKRRSRVNYKSHNVSEYIWTCNALIHEHRPALSVRTVSDIKSVIAMNIDTTLNARLTRALTLINGTTSNG